VTSPALRVASATWQIRVADRDIGFDCADGETLLDAAERAGFTLPYSCRKGVCFSCEGAIVAGEAEQRGRGAIAGPRSGVLYCQATPRSDLDIAPKRISTSAPPARKRISARVFRLHRPAPDVTLLHLRYPPQDRVHFRAGQHLEVTLDDGSRRNYSMAGAPQETNATILHIRRIPGGRFSAAMMDALRPGDRLAIELPFGEFCLQEDDGRPVILLASGTGMAPVASILEDLARRSPDRHVDVYWGVRHEADLYLTGQVARWRSCLPRLRFTPVVSRPGPGWAGRTGQVPAAMLADHPDPSRNAVYACGSPAMVSLARELLIANGLPDVAFFSEAFVSSAN
jgi:CDP-4-dehydro-6-deoxyglucose reductase